MLTPLILGGYHIPSNTAWCIPAAIVNFGPTEIAPVLSTDMAAILKPYFFVTEEGNSRIGR